MDKYEYKIRADEIKELIARGEYTQAAEIADAIDWRRVKNVMMLCTISDLYKINRRYEDAKNMMDLAYERRPGGRTICYALCELCIKIEDFGSAIKYYQEFVQAAPRDYGRYILQYKLFEAQDRSLEERIGVLEELKKRDYREKWAYELAYLYHRVGLATRCVEECDELILWFGEGKYVIKAMELKMLHQPLTAVQQEKYDHRFDIYQEPVQEEEPESEEQIYGSAKIYVDMQRESAEPQVQEDVPVQGNTQVYEGLNRMTQPVGGAAAGVDLSEELDFRVKTLELGTLDVEAEVRAGMQEVMEDELSKSEAITRSIVAPMMETESLDYPELTDEDVSEEDIDEGVEQIEGTEVFFGETGEVGAHSLESAVGDVSAGREEPPEPEPSDVLGGSSEVVLEISERPDAHKEIVPEISEVYPEDEKVVQERSNEITEVTVHEEQKEIPKEAADAAEQDETAKIVMNQLRMENIGRAEQQAMIAQPPKELAGVLSQESDGQISLVIPERETVEKQITGQMSISDILFEWEQMKKETEERRKEEVRQHVLRQTGPMFTEFEASVRDGLLEQLESGQLEGEAAEEAGDIDQEDINQENINVEEDQDVTSEQHQEAEVAANENTEVGTIEDYAPEQLEGGAYSEEFVSEEDLGEVEELEEVLEDMGGEEEEAVLEDAPEGYEDDSELSEKDGGEQLNQEDSKKEDFYEVDIEDQSEADVEEPSEAEGSGEEPGQDFVEREQAKVRALTREEKELFAPYIQSKAAREQLVKALDNISMASYTGNVIITGGEGMDTSTLAKNIIREVQVTDSNFAGKVAKISGQALNKKNIAATLQQLKNGALIINKASGMNDQTASALHKALQGESLGIIVVMEDTRKAMGRLLEQNKDLTESFTARVDVEALSNDTLVSFGRQYAKEREYSIDDLGVLALHTRIEELQTIDHAVTVMEVKEIVDEAIHYANRKTLGHFIDVLLAKRYDEEDMIILTEKDFA